jgi:flagellum-specific peptidoglycan hydrolase FlgJ
MDISKKNFLDATSAAAEAAGHLFPTMAACEAAEESGYGTSGLSIADHNLFGMKQHKHPVYGTHVLPTKECLDGKWEIVNAAFIHYPSTKECFQDRMVTLLRLATAYPHYAAAVAAKDPVVFVTEVSKTWSTDPNRAKNIIAIFNQYVGG